MSNFAQQLKAQTAAVKLRRSVFGVRRRLTEPQKQKIADAFSAQAGLLSAGKKLLDTKQEAYRAVSGVISRARGYWKSMTVFYPVRGIRLIRRDLIEVFETQMKLFGDELQSNLDQLCSRYQQLKQEAKNNLGELYRQADYPSVEDLRDEFSISWEYPSVDPPDYLKQLNPALYEQEQARVAARFEEAMVATEQLMAGELKSLIEGLCDRLAPSTGKKKSLSASAIKGFAEFVDKFKTLSVRSDSELASIVAQAEQLTKGIDPAALKQNNEQQGQLFTTFGALKDSLDLLVVDAPTRKIDLEDE